MAAFALHPLFLAPTFVFLSLFPHFSYLYVRRISAVQLQPAPVPQWLPQPPIPPSR